MGEKEEEVEGREEEPVEEVQEEGGKEETDNTSQQVRVNCMDEMSRKFVFRGKMARSFHYKKS